MTAPALPSTEAIDRLMAAVESEGGEVEIDAHTVDVSTAMESRRVTSLRIEVKAVLRVSA